MTQFPILEDLLTALGFVVWPQITYEADDAMGAAAAAAASDDRVERVFICTPDKDLAQCVRGDRVVQLDRRKGVVTDRNGVIEKFGVPPESIPDYLGLVGDNADGFPGLPGWGAKTTAAVLTRYGHLENIPAAPGQWDVVGIRGAAKLAATLQAQFEDALLFRELARLQCEGPEVGAVDDWRWVGPLNPLPPIVGYVDGVHKAEIDLTALHANRFEVYGVSNSRMTAPERADAMRDFIRDVLPMLQDGRIVPVVDKVFRFDDLTAAKKYVESDAQMGKVVVRVQ